MKTKKNKHHTQQQSHEGNISTDDLGIQTGFGSFSHVAELRQPVFTCAWVMEVEMSGAGVTFHIQLTVLTSHIHFIKDETPTSDVLSAI